jgi:hypothetical protein
MTGEIWVGQRRNCLARRISNKFAKAGSILPSNALGNLWKTLAL